MFDNTQPSFESLIKIFSEKTRQVVFWTGAGLSKPAGLPTWVELRDQMLQRAEKSLSAIDLEESVFRAKQSLIGVARYSSDFWQSFTFLHQVMGETTYTESVRSIFRTAERCRIPENYIKILEVQPEGIITTNIDQLVQRACATTEQGTSPAPCAFSGKECEKYLHLLPGGRFFILNLHGILDDRDSWGFTKNERDKIYTSSKEFLGTCFLSKCIVFLGATITDPSIVAHLDRVRGENAVHCQSLFWITSDNSQATRVFCEQRNILPIYYNANDNHAELNDILIKLKAYRSKDEVIQRPVISEQLNEQNDQKFSDIRLDQLPLNELRIALNRESQRILAPSSPQAYEDYKRFRSENERFIHNAWYVSPQDTNGNKVFNFSIIKEIADGAFARVFEAKDEKDNTVALKLLKEDVMRKEEWLQTFRRGVNAMRILERRQSQGIVKYITASEIPAFVVMEFVDGVTLKDAVEKKQFTEWQHILPLLCKIADIVRMAHGLPERVLHRDLRPPNVMLKGFQYNPDDNDWSVCILDFDLAFYKDANEVSIQPTSDASGFLAPEQVEGKSALTRSALVDSYGMAMLIYYVVTRQVPRPEQCKHKDWADILLKSVAEKPCKEWVSLPYRLARLIEQCTRYEQAQRWDMTRIHGYLCAMEKAYNQSDTISDGDILAEELATRVAKAIAFMPLSLTLWNQDRAEASIKKITGEEITIKAFSDGIVHVAIEWDNEGSTEYRAVTKNREQRIKMEAEKFSKLGIKVEQNIRPGGASLKMEVPKQKVFLHMDDLVKKIVSIKIAPKF